MRFALINPNWTFDGSIYFGCREPHLPIEYGYAAALLEQAGHTTELIDAQLEELSLSDIQARVAAFQPDLTVITTAPSYLFWRCAPPELRVPQQVVNHVKSIAGTLIAIGPHASTTPSATLKKLAVDGVVLGECEEILPRFATDNWETIPAIVYWKAGQVQIQGNPHVTDVSRLPALHWPDQFIQRHQHHHHRFEAAPAGLGAEMETSRGCPYHCSFCAKENFRNGYRRRPLAIVLDELDGLMAQGVEYVYFIDEIFLPDRDLLMALMARSLKFGIQTRIDLWSYDLLAQLGQAGCVSIEAGVESISQLGREQLNKRCKLSTEELSDRLIYAKQHVPFVQANLLQSGADDPEAIDQWRDVLRSQGVWANQPVPLFPYPGSPRYTQKWGLPDDLAWERAHADYLQTYAEFSDMQTAQPQSLAELEGSPS